MLCSPLRLAHHGAAHWPDVLPTPAPQLFAYIRVYWLRTASRRQCRRRWKVVCLSTDRVRTSTSEWVSISLISFNFSVFRPLIMRLWPDVANLRAQFCPIPLVAPVVKAIFLTVIVRFEWGSKKNWVPVRFVWVTTVVAGDCKSRQIERAYQGKQGVNAVSGRSLLY